MAATVELIDPRKIQKNPDNPRLIFRQDELDELRESINDQGILVPLSVFKDGRHFTLLDGERRWRCAIDLGLHNVPAIVQDKPDPVTNIMMMFAIHNARKDWDPLPTALKLEELEKMLVGPHGEAPTEAKLAAAASISRGEVRRYRKILAIPKRFRRLLLQELEKPRPEQKVTVDQVVEAVDGAKRLVKARILEKDEASHLTQTIVDKFRAEILTSTVEPRRLTKIASAVERGEVSRAQVQRQLRRFESTEKCTLNEVYESTVQQLEFARGTEQLLTRTVTRLQQLRSKDVEVTEELRTALQNALKEIRALLGS
ncbi:MAG: ParB/RepB/Spo0J family partition protein [Hyphomonadaceae bacterium]